MLNIIDVRGTIDSLPEEILMDVFGRLILLDDMVVFGAVCKSWHSVAIASLRHKICTPPAVPFLMLPEEEEEAEAEEKEKEENSGDGVRKLYCLADRRIHRLRLPQVKGKKCFSIGFGWMLTIGIDLQIDMVHLLRGRVGRRISLPPESSLPLRFEPIHFTNRQLQCGTIRKVVASADHPSSSPCIIMAIYGEFSHLAFTSPNHDAWVAVDLPTPMTFMDVVFCHNKFYAVTQWGCITVCTITHDPDEPTGIKVSAMDLGTRSPSHVDQYSQKYLVESRTGDLLLVGRTLDFEASNRKCEDVTNRFEVLRLEEQFLDDVGPTDEDDDDDNNKQQQPNFILVGGVGKNKYEFVRVDSLGDQAIFLGDNSSFSLTASPANGCKPNCIYFTDDQFNFGMKPIGSDMGVYHLGDGTIERIPVVHPLASRCPPLWYI